MARKKRQPPGNPPAPTAKVAGLSLLLFLLVAGTFLPAVRHDFITYDDESYVTRNLQVQGGLTPTGIRWAFTTFTQANWHPLSWISHMLDCQLFGLQPWGHHLTSVLLHAINAVLLFLVLRSLTGAVGRSLFVAALFGLHPLHVESVAWVAERKDVLSTLFFLLLLGAYTRYARGAPRFYFLALIWFGLGLLCKPMLVTVPFVLLLLDYWPLRRMAAGAVGGGAGDRRAASAPVPAASWKRLILEKAPFLLLAVASAVVTFAAQRSGRTLTAIASLPLGDRLGNALVSYCRYLGRLFWPTRLAVFYPHPGRWAITTVAVSALVLLALTVGVWILRKRRPYLVTGWLWYVGMLLPVIGIVQVGWQSMADRYTYVPLIGMFLLLTWAAADLTGRWRPRRIILPAAGVLVLGLCTAVTLRQLTYWQNSGTLFRHAIAVTGKNYIACANLANYAVEKGDLDTALAAYREVVRIDPDAQAHSNLGFVLYRKGQMGEALSHFEEALKEEPGYADAHIGAGMALAAQARVEEAIARLNEALRLKPDSPLGHFSLAYLLAAAGRSEEAIRHYQQTLALQPHYPGAAEQLRALAATNRPPAQ